MSKNFCAAPQPRRDYVETQTPEIARDFTHDARLNLRRIGYHTNARGFVKWLTLRRFQDRLLQGRSGGARCAGGIARQIGGSQRAAGPSCNRWGCILRLPICAPALVLRKWR